MNLKLNENEKRLKDAFMILPPDLTLAGQLLSQENYTVENISKVGTDFVWECVEEGWATLEESESNCWEYFWPDNRIQIENVIPGLHSTYVCDVLMFLLQHGLDPNAVFEEENMMDNLKYLDNGYLAADALALLFEHGGNPNLICDGPSIFSEIDFDVFFDAANQYDRHRFSSLVHCWMVYLAYGATNPDGSVPVTVSRGFDIRRLKNHRQFFFGITQGDHWPDIHIFDKNDMWEVVRG